jgi:1-phosphofructokinase
MNDNPFMAKIITITTNTAIDLFITLEGLGVKETIQANSSQEFACGKGVNVARGLASLSQPVMCLGFIGKQSQTQFQALNSKFIHTDFIAVEGKTRTNLTLFDTASNKETHIRTAGFKVSQQDCEALCMKLKTLLKSGDILVLSGSLPPGTGAELYRRLIAVCRQQQAVVLLDSNGEGLQQVLSAKPWLIKPNQQELEALVGVPLKSEQDMIAASRSIIALGIEWVCVSCGERGVIAVNGRQAWAANVTHVPGAVQTHVGCGDALVAGLAYAKLHDGDTEQMLAQGVCCAVANLFSKEPGAFNAIDVDRIRPLLQIRQL